MKLLLLTLVLAGAGLAQAGTPTLTASVWKREVIPMEPILVQVEVHNPGPDAVCVVPPYPPSPYCALGIVVVDERGTRVASNIRGAPSPYSVAAYGETWWLRLGPGRPPMVPDRYPWSVPPTGAAWFWFDLTRFYPLDAPGRYHVTLQYASEAHLLSDPTGPAGAPPLWTGSQDLDLGWIEVQSPQGEEAEIADLLREARDKRRWVLSSTSYQWDDAAHRIWEQYRDTRYAPYARMYLLWFSALWVAAPPLGSQSVGEAVAEFRQAYPDFPLNHQLPLVQAAHECIGLLGARAVGPDEAPEGAYAELRHVAAGTGDAGMVGLVERLISLAEQGHQLSVARTGQPQQ